MAIYFSPFVNLIYKVCLHFLFDENSFWAKTKETFLTVHLFSDVKS